MAHRKFTSPKKRKASFSGSHKKRRTVLARVKKVEKVQRLRRPEVKRKFSTLGAALVPAVNLATAGKGMIATIIPGDTALTRDGDRIHLVKVGMRFILSNHTTNPEAAIVRCLVVQQRSIAATSEVIPLLGYFLEADFVTSPLKPASLRPGYSIVYDRRVMLPAGTISTGPVVTRAIRTMSVYPRIPIKNIQYVTAGSGVIMKGTLYYFVFSDNDLSTPNHTIYDETVWTDI